MKSFDVISLENACERILRKNINSTILVSTYIEIRTLVT